MKGIQMDGGDLVMGSLQGRKSYIHLEKENAKREVNIGKLSTIPGTLRTRKSTRKVKK